MCKNLSSKDDQTSVQSLQFGEALWRMSLQYITVLIKPSVSTLSDAMEKASWGRVLVQFLQLVIIMITISFLESIVPSTALHGITALSASYVKPLRWPHSLLNGITLVLVSFFIGLGTAYWGSKICGGQGTFLAHLYCLLLCTVPLVAVSSVVLLLPVTGWLLLLPGSIVSALFIYRMILHTITIMAVHRLGVGQAIVIVLILPVVIVIVGLLVNTHGEVLGDFCDGFLDVGNGKPRKTADNSTMR